jgi:uncharacterized protein YndB with AHSA1/START domain
VWESADRGGAGKEWRTAAGALFNRAMSEQTVRASALVRRPPREVFEAFANAETITKFWLTRTSGPLAPGAVVQWEFMVPGAKETVTVTGFEPGRRIAFTWASGLKVDMAFEPYPGDATRVIVTVGAFEEKDLLEQVANVVEGFSIVLCDLKTLLEQGRSANLVRDKAELIAKQRGA